ncbi:hypothetical protein RUM43_012522, partial [Polyplax serrata]
LKNNNKQALAVFNLPLSPKFHHWTKKQLSKMDNDSGALDLPVANRQQKRVTVTETAGLA